MEARQKTSGHLRGTMRIQGAPTRWLIFVAVFCISIYAQLDASSLSLLTILDLVAGTIVKHCPAGDPSLCISVGRPDNGASTTTSELFIQIQGPTDRQYLAVGQGRAMAGSNMFLVYLDAAGQNVTLSPRVGKGHRMPQFSTDATVALMEGSGVAEGKLTANIRCKLLSQP